MKEFVLQNRFDPEDCKIDYRNELNPEQLNVVLNGDGPCLVLAGAGSGKTRTITYRVAYLIENGVSPDNILLVTFTNKAAREMLGRVEGLLHAYPAGLWGGTFHSIANRLLRAYAPAVGHTPSFNIMDEEDARDLIKMCVKELGVDTTERRFPSPANLHNIISYAMNAGIPIRESVQRKHSGFWNIIPTIERVAELYEARKSTADVMDFDDLLILLRNLLRDNPVVRDRLAQQFRYILVDEYQDTNTVQADIIRMLAGVHGNVVVVGDDAQSIYSFRAAQIKNILDFEREYPGAHVVKLEQNYRSTQVIVEAASALISNNKIR
ncbi:ATP-dependent helicase, partial [bacterium]|nr:ATP-dependent helicase [bacterium]